MTRAEYEAKVLSLKGTHDYNMLCFIRGGYITSLEAENAKLKDALEKAARTLDEDNCCPDTDVAAQCDGIIDDDRANCRKCWLDWLMDNNQNKGDKDE